MATDLMRLRCRWDGWKGGPGISTFYADPAGASVQTPLKNFFNAFANYLPNGITITIPSSGDTIDDATGALTGQWSAGADQVVTGSSSQNMSIAAGPFVTWSTGALHRGRHLRGRTFLVPFAVSAFASDGSIDATLKGIVNTACGTLMTNVASALMVWGRPVLGVGGSSAPVTSGACSSKAGVLRSRRD